MPPVLSLLASKKLHEILGGYQCDLYTKIDADGKILNEWAEPTRGTLRLPGIMNIERSNFSELVRLIPRLGKKLNWEQMFHGGIDSVICELSEIFAHASSPEKGMEACEEYLMKLLK